MASGGRTGLGPARHLILGPERGLVVEQVELADDRGLLGRGQRHLHDLQRVAPRAVEGCPAAVRVHVHEHAIRAARVGDHRVRVRPAPRAHGRGVPRSSRVADVEDADALPVLVGLGHARRLARVVGHGLVDRDDDEVADRADVALPARARDGAHELGCRGIGDVPDGEPRVVALHQVVAREREVGVDEVGVVALPERVVAMRDPLEPGADRRLALGGRRDGRRGDAAAPRTPQGRDADRRRSRSRGSATGSHRFSPAVAVAAHGRVADERGERLVAQQGDRSRTGVGVPQHRLACQWLGGCREHDVAEAVARHDRGEARASTSASTDASVAATSRLIPRPAVASVFTTMSPSGASSIRSSSKNSTVDMCRGEMLPEKTSTIARS